MLIAYVPVERVEALPDTTVLQLGSENGQGADENYGGAGAYPSVKILYSRKFVSGASWVPILDSE